MEQGFDMGRLKRILEGIKPARENLIPVLQTVQEEFGYIPPESIRPVADYMGVFPSEISGIITFYAQFCTTPRGRNVIRVCRGTACHVRGGRTVLNAVKNLTEIEDGETSSDMRFTLETVACLGACALSPVMVVNKTYYGKLNSGRIEAVLKNLP
ncbi:MAG: NADH-quinone oxidoreductase subunit NuoE [Desulfomonile sp.]